MSTTPNAWAANISPLRGDGTVQSVMPTGCHHQQTARNSALATQT